MTIKKIIKELKAELKDIEKDYDPSDWDYQDVDKLDSNEAYARGYYRAYESVLSMLKK
jgi:hypothetical protein